MEQIKFEVYFTSERDFFTFYDGMPIGLKGIKKIREFLDLPKLDLNLIDKYLHRPEYLRSVIIEFNEEEAINLNIKAGLFENDFREEIKVMGHKEDYARFIEDVIVVKKNSNGGIKRVYIKRKIDTKELYYFWKISCFTKNLSTVDITV